MSHIAFKRFRPGGAQSAPAVEAFLGRLENWLDEAGLHNIGLSFEAGDRGRGGGPELLHVDLAPARPDAARIGVSICVWPDGDAEFHVSVHGDRDILHSDIEDRLDADRVLALCKSIAAGRLVEDRLTAGGRVLGQRAQLPVGRAATLTYSNGASGLSLDRLLSLLPFLRTECIRYAPWKPF